MTGQSLHATHHHGHKAGAHVFDYARGFGNTAKEGLKRTTRWAAHYFTNKKSYYLCHPILLAFGTSQFCHLYQLFRWNQERMRERTHERMDAQQRKKCTSKDCSTRNHQVQGRHSPLNIGDSSDLEMDIDDEIENDLTFLRTTPSGQSITINRSLF
ncbi:hypothetical protein P5673_018305 [Acropora cervicornis]|uniref:Uncharacterized protein n=1 Tax=Acropora cervicornis TaxID=6130 RepID=A0AAD9QDF5_ACRCE|nr:hypothetical protein P5673_018305 [Acropora cervicornis]